MFKKFLVLLGVLVYSTSLFGSAGKHAVAQKALATASAMPMKVQQEAVQWKGKPRSMHSICFSPNGKWAIGKYSDAIAALPERGIVVFSIDQETGTFKEMSIKTFHEIGDIYFSDNGKHVIASVAHFDGVSQYRASIDLFSFDEKTGEIHEKETIVDCSIQRFDPLSKLVVSAVNGYLAVSLRNIIAVYAYDETTQKYTLLISKTFDSHILHAAYSPDGKYLAVVRENDARTVKVEILNVRLESIDSFTMPKGLRKHTINYSPDGKKLMVMTGQAFAPLYMFDVDDKSRKVIGESLFQFNTCLMKDDASKYSANGRYLFFRGVFIDAESHRERLVLTPVDSTGYPTMNVSDEQFRGIADTRVLSEEDYIRDFALCPQENILAVVTDHALELYEFDDETGTVAPLQGQLLQSYVKKQGYERMKEALPEALTQPKQPVLAILHEYIFGPSKTVQSQPQQKEEHDESEVAFEVTQKQQQSKDEDAMKLFAAIKDDDLKKVKEVLTPFTLNAKADLKEDERTPLLQAIWLNKHDIATFILNVRLVQYYSRLHSKPVQADVALADAKGNSALKLAFLAFKKDEETGKDVYDYPLALAIAKKMTSEQRKGIDQHENPYLVYALEHRKKEGLADQDKKSLDELIELLKGDAQSAAAGTQQK